MQPANSQVADEAVCEKLLAVGQPLDPEAEGTVRESTDLRMVEGVFIDADPRHLIRA
jgi:hypothetical protein